MRILPVSSLLSYNLDDSNERIFEASIAAEVLKNTVILSYCNVIADFLLATHPTLHYIADPRVLLSVRKLKRLSATEVEKGSKKVPVLPLIPAVTSSPIIEVVREHESGEVDEELERFLLMMIALKMKFRAKPK